MARFQQTLASQVRFDKNDRKSKREPFLDLMAQGVPWPLSGVPLSESVQRTSTGLYVDHASSLLFTTMDARNIKRRYDTHSHMRIRGASQQGAYE